jgi:hypothetical protein
MCLNPEASNSTLYVPGGTEALKDPSGVDTAFSEAFVAVFVMVITEFGTG